LRFDHQLSAELAVHASAMGKAILAHSGDTAESAIRAFGTLSAFTASTITTAEELEMELARVRANGFAVNRGERYDGVTGVAAPILDHHGAAYAAIGVQGPSVRLTDERIAEVARVVTDAAASMRAS
jgi:IclR family acetate operon transcriptional repressor